MTVAVKWQWRARELARSSGTAVEVEKLVAMVVDWVMVTATAAIEGSDNNQQNLRVTKWAMARATRTIVTNAFAAIAVVLSSAVTAAAVIAAAATTAVAIAHLFNAVKRRWRGQWQWKRSLRRRAIAAVVAIAHLFNTTIKWQWRGRWRWKHWLRRQGWRVSDGDNGNSDGNNTRDDNGNKVVSKKEGDGESGKSDDDDEEEGNGDCGKSNGDGNK